jgi:hypothetical protein
LLLRSFLVLDMLSRTSFLLTTHSDNVLGRRGSKLKHLQQQPPSHADFSIASCQGWSSLKKSC